MSYCPAGAAIYQDTFYAQIFQVLTKQLDGSAPLPLDLTGATFAMWFRQFVSDTGAPLLELTTDFLGGLSFVDAAEGRMQASITAAQTAVFPLGYIYADLMRTDQVPNVPQRYFGIRFLVNEAVTRL